MAVFEHEFESLGGFVSLNAQLLGCRESRSLEEVPLEVVERDLLACASRLFALEARFLVLVAAFDRREGWAGDGVRSCAHWLSWRCGISIHASRERVRVARALEQLPRLSEAFGTGRISYSKVRAVTRVATPEDEATWLDLAESGTATHVERISAGCRRALAPDESDDGETGADDGPAELGEVRLRYLPDGRVELVAVLAADDAELVMQAMLSASAPESGDHGAEGRKRRYEPGSLAPRCAGGLRGMADSYLAHGPGQRDNGASHLVVVQVDADVLAEARDPEPYEFGQLEATGRRLAGHVLRRLACDATIQAAVTGPDGLVTMGRRRRLVSARQRRALAVRDGGCVFPSCTERRWVDAHHMQHWADGGPTELWNLALLCRSHHTTVHEGGFQLELVEGRVVVRRVDGSQVPISPRLPDAADPTAPDPVIGPTVVQPTCHWSGHPLDLRWAVASVCDEVTLSRSPSRDAA
jgi:Domain of unknown function (DUF222)/HNH endonuclease